MLPSLHDNFVVAYNVNCDARQIKLYARRDPRGRLPHEQHETCIIIFNGVEGYQFENDAFGNIIFSLREIPVEKLLAEQRFRIAESYRMAGAPGSWAADLDSAAETLEAVGVQAFELSSSYGLSGWILAKEVLVEPMPRGLED